MIREVKFESQDRRIIRSHCLHDDANGIKDIEEAMLSSESSWSRILIRLVKKTQPICFEK